MATTSINTNFLSNAPGYVYLLDAPTTNPGSDTVYANVVTGYYGMFFTSGLHKTDIKGGVLPWCNLTSNGISAKITGDPLKAMNNFGQEQTGNLKTFKFEGELTFTDADAAHMKDVLSINTGSVITIAAATGGQPGQTILPVGSVSKLKSYTLCYVYETPDVPGEFSSYLLPKVKLVPEVSVELNSDKLIEAKIKFTAEMDQWLRDPNTLKPVLGIRHDSTAPRIA